MNKSLHRRIIATLQAFVRSNMAFSGDFTPVLARHSKSISLTTVSAAGIDRESIPPDVFSKTTTS